MGERRASGRRRSLPAAALIFILGGGRRVLAVLGLGLLVLLVVMAVRRLGAGFVGGIAVGFVLGILAVVAGMMLLARSMRSRIAENLQPPALPKVQIWDYVMELRTLEGEKVDASNFRGRVLFLNFWATWCAPCVAEMPSIERMAAHLAGTNLAIACVTREPAEKVGAFTTKKGWKLDMYRIDGEAPPMFETRSIPATFVIAPDGRVLLSHLGAARWDSDEIVDFLRNSATHRSSPSQSS